MVVGMNLSYFDRDQIATNKVGLPCGSVTSADDHKFLQGLAVARDNGNAGMSRKEMVAIIADMKGVHLRTAENHYDHLIRTKKLSQLKNNGRVIRAQPTTTNRTAITTEKLLRTYNTQLEAWAIKIN